MRSPIGKKQGETQNITQKYRQEFGDFRPETRIIYWTPDGRQFNLKNENRHDDGEDSIRKLV